MSKSVRLGVDFFLTLCCRCEPRIALIEPRAKHDLASARPALERSLALNAADPVAHFRMGKVLQAAREDPRALAEYEAAIRGARSCPSPILGAAYLEAARLHERAGRREQAVSLYRVAASLVGAAADTRAAATRALTRLGASTAGTPRH